MRACQVRPGQTPGRTASVAIATGRCPAIICGVSSPARLSTIDLSDSLGRATWRVAWPVMLMQALFTTLNVADMFWVGRLGPVSVAAVALSGSALGVLFSAGQLFTVGALATSSRAAGADDRQGVRDSLRHALLLAVLFAIPAAATGFALAAPVLGLFRPAAEVIAAGVPYMRIIFVALPAYFAGMVLYSVYQALGDTRTPMLVILATNVLNALLDPVMIFGWLGFPRLGVTGAALATVLSQSGGLVVMASILRQRGLLQLGGPIRLSALRTLAGIGIPAGLQAVTRPLTGMAMFRLVGAFGTGATAAFGIGMRALEVMFIYLGALGSAGEVLVGQSLGQRRPDIARRVARRITLIALLLQVAAMPLLFAFAPAVIAVFSRDPDVVRLGTGYLRMLAPMLVTVALVTGWGSAQRGAGATGMPMVAALVANWGAKIPLTLVLSRFADMGLTGVWLGIGLSIVVEAILLGVGYFRGAWLKKEVAWS